MASTKLFRNDIKAGTPLRLVSNDSNGKLSELVYHLNADNSWATANDAENLRLVTQYAIKQYIASQISQSGSTIDWQDSVKEACGMITIDYYGPHTIGDRYLCNNIDYGYEEYLNQIITWNGTTWIKTPPNVGMMTYDEKNETFMFYYSEAIGWDVKTFGITYTGGNGIRIVGSEVSIKILTSNSGFTLNSSGLSLNSKYFKLQNRRFKWTRI